MRSTVRPIGDLISLCGTDLKPRNLYRIIAGHEEDVGSVVLCTDSRTIVFLYIPNLSDGSDLFASWFADVVSDYRFEPFSGELILTS